MKVLVYLGIGMTFSLSEWIEQWKNGMGENALPYGYDKVGNDSVHISYAQANRIEKLLLPRYRMRKGYLEWVKLPLLLLTHDVVWTHFDVDTLHIARLKHIPLLGRFFAKCLGQLIWTMDDLTVMKPAEKARLRHILSVVEMITVQSPTAIKVLEKNLDLPHEKLTFIPYGINLSSYIPENPKSKPADLPEGLHDYILIVGSDKDRDINLFLEVASRMADHRFVLATKNEHFLQARYPSNINVISASYREMLWLYAECSCVIIPLKYNEHVSGITTIMEAAGMKKPVIVTETPGMALYTDHGRTAISVSVGNAEEIVNAVISLETQPTRSAAMTVYSYQYVCEHFLDTIYAKGYLDASRKMLRPHQSD